MILGDNSVTLPSQEAQASDNIDLFYVLSSRWLKMSSTKYDTDCKLLSNSSGVINVTEVAEQLRWCEERDGSSRTTQLGLET